MSGSLLQSLGLQPILDMREREAMAEGEAYRQKYAQEFQAEESKRARRAGLLTTILTGAATIGGAMIGGGAGAAAGSAIGKGLSGLFNKNKTQPSQFTPRLSGSNQFNPVLPRLSGNNYNQSNSLQNLLNVTDPNNPYGRMTQ